MENRIKSEDCVLEMGDNSSDMGWMRRSFLDQKIKMRGTGFPNMNFQGNWKTW